MKLLRYPELPSTNDLAARLAEQQHADAWTVVVAGMQTAGRGRHGRSWTSPPGAGIYASVILRPSDDVVPLLTLAAGVAIAEGIAAATALQTELKWPNDVYAGGRKLAGILAERGSAHVVLGFGINVLTASYPADIAARATSIETELGRPVDPELVLSECLAALRARYADLQRGQSAIVVDEWRRRAASTVGRRVEWLRGQTHEQGVAIGVDDMGALLVQSAAGVSRVTAGEVRWI